MKTSRLVVALGLLAVAGTAFAVAQFVNEQKDITRFKQAVTVLQILYADGGIVVGPGGNRIPNSYTGVKAHDFGELGAGAINCEDSYPITVTGAALGDFCVATSNFGMDGGLTQDIEASLTCRVTAANAAKVRVCAARADAGTLNLPDAGYYVRTFGR